MNASAPAETNLGDRPTSSAKSVLLTLLGEFVAPTGGAVWTGTLIDGLAALGYGDGNARQAMARLRDDGVLTPERHGRKTRWHLTDAGQRLLDDGAERIYSFGAGTEGWDGTWLLITCSIPESQRDKRHRFQTRLAFAGFGFASPTMAVSPHASAEPTANRILEELGLAEVALVLRAETGSLTSDRTMLERSWDLAALGAAYDDFVDTFAGVQPAGRPDAFRELVRLVHAWRQFPFADPELPPELLPDGWPGTVASALFTDARASWSADAGAHYAQLEAAHG